jgi:hypothetical protein
MRKLRRAAAVAHGTKFHSKTTKIQQQVPPLPLRAAQGPFQDDNTGVNSRSWRFRFARLRVIVKKRPLVIALQVVRCCDGRGADLCDPPQ